jgi:hypothetical protein
MALDFLSIPGMSAEPERLFSHTKITITDRRNRLGSDTIEALECLQSWLGIRDQEMELMKTMKEETIIPASTLAPDREATARLK